MERGLNKNILAISPEPEDIAYLQMLFWKNFSTTPLKAYSGCEFEHIIYSFSPTVETLYRLQEEMVFACLLYTSPSPRDGLLSRMPSSA